jgi:hypothetical protein
MRKLNATMKHESFRRLGYQAKAKLESLLDNYMVALAMKPILLIHI